MNSKLVKYLFQTQALKFAPAAEPFWYTSGKIGPFFINTHYLYGSADMAGQQLASIEEAVQDPLTMTARLTDEFAGQYHKNEIYRFVADALHEGLADFIDAADYISGGERRDFFFSFPLALLSGKPHVSFLKDGRTVWTEHGKTYVTRDEKSAFAGAKGLHIADIITEASSFLRNWIPQTEAMGAKMAYAGAVIDRGQGGDIKLRDEKVVFRALMMTDREFFLAAVEHGEITKAQAEQSLAFLADPDRFMENFYAEHPDFIAAQLAAGGKKRERAELAIEKGYAKLP